MKWEGLEEKFDVEVPSQLFPGKKIRLRGKRDGRYREADNGLWLFETKTKSRIDDIVIAKKLSFDTQVMVYAYTIFLEHGEWIRGVKYNLIRRPGLRHKIGESNAQFLQRIQDDVECRPDHYFMRYEATLSKEEFGQYTHEFAHMIQDIELWYANDINYRNPNSCGFGNYVCPYMNICSTGNRTGFVKSLALYPELSVAMSASEK
jgi:hypothetical protein